MMDFGALILVAVGLTLAGMHIKYVGLSADETVIFKS